MPSKVSNGNMATPPPTIRTVAVLGGSGALGKHMVRALLDAKPELDKVVVVSRSEASASGASDPRLERRTVSDYSDSARLADALCGVDCVVSTVASDSVAVQADWAPALASAGVKLFFPSEYGITENEEEAELADNYYNAARRKVLQAFKSVSIPTVRFCCGWFGEYLDYPPLFTVNLDKGTAEINGDGNATVTWTFMGDVAAGVANLVADPSRWWDRVKDGYWEVGVAGDDRTINQAADLIEKYSDIPLKRIYTPISELQAKYDALLAANTSHFDTIFLELSLTQAKGQDRIPPSRVENELVYGTGRKLRSVEDYVREKYRKE